ncbi:hypothetical protein M0R72_21980 [Candidatus Pacearchaeota archaeon]|jgi:hypothetical protein|nr:hypothetical protein [Candidatus Pacearchaeota archaeon]
MRLEATYAGQGAAGHHLLKDVSGDCKRDHHWVNLTYGNWPEDVAIGARVRFFASPLYTRRGVRITDIREVKVI